MRLYRCGCGNALFYDNSRCLVCNSEVGFCPQCQEIVSLASQSDGTYRCGNADCGAALAKCANWMQHNVCNQCVLLASVLQLPLCDCCRFNATIPDLSVAGNLEKWASLEAAKRRLFYDLNLLGLPYGTEAEGFKPPLAFDFKADVIPADGVWRNTNRAEKIYTGHVGGKITINIREADEVEREKMRVEMREPQRTLIGHFRHEIGHYYWEMLVKPEHAQEFTELFGDDNNPPYSQALERHYQIGPPPDWRQRFISAYASVHPWEDFAETWACYLDMVALLETAQNVGFVRQDSIAGDDVDEMVLRYQRLGIALNEMNREFGLLDVVPEVLVPAVVKKLRFVHEIVGSAARKKLVPAPVNSQGALLNV